MAAELLTGRVAHCYCGTEKPSSPSLAFFEFCGEGSPEAIRRCKHCAYFDVAHEGPVPARYNCPGFEPNGPLDHDRFYCGHAGWD